MTQEEKAKRYDELAKEVKGFFEGKQKMYSDIIQTLNYLFPELKENEDEKIRKGIISGMTAIKEQGKETFAAIRINDCIAWLEKQGKQKPQGKTALEAINEEKVDNQFCIKPVNKVEPKFRVGDWIIGKATNNEPRQISEITDQCYKSTYGGQYGFSFEDELHLWSIKDAKDGDILVYNNSIFIFNEISENWLIYYGIYEKNAFHNDKCYSFLNLDNMDVNNIHPSTKEQRDTLERAITNAGYTFDFEKKELKKIKDETSIAVNNPDAYKIGFADGEAHAKEEQWKPSDEQIKHLTDVVYDAKHKNRISTNGYEPYSYLYALLMQLKRLKG